MFLVGTLIEVGAYILLDPGSFTFLVCLKSLGLAWVWMGRKKDGVFVSCLKKVRLNLAIYCYTSGQTRQTQSDPARRRRLDRRTQQESPIVDTRAQAPSFSQRSTPSGRRDQAAREIL